jgi:hypothetical protein
MSPEHVTGHSDVGISFATLPTQGPSATAPTSERSETHADASASPRNVAVKMICGRTMRSLLCPLFFGSCSHGSPSV